MRLIKFLLLGMLFFILVTLPSNGQIGEKLSIHGFGGWGYGKTDGNKYLIGNSEGSFRNSQFALNLMAKPYEKLTISTQIFTEAGLAKDKVELDYAFFEWEFSSALKLRVGKVKCPFGIYSEIYEVGTVRPFFMLPQAVYGKKGVTNKSYYGAGITGNLFLNDQWSFQYDLFGGELVFQDWVNVIVVPVPFPPYWYEISMNIQSYDEDTIGGRLTVYTPVDGLNFGVSYFTGKPKFTIDAENVPDIEFFKPGRYYDLNFHVEYLSDSLSIRSEYLYAGRMEEKDLTMKSGYIETAYKFLTNWQIAFQYNKLKMEVPSLNSNEKHDEFAFGLNYWISSDFVLKCSYHIVDGNYSTQPENFLESVLSGKGLKEKTNLFIFGTQFSF